MLIIQRSHDGDKPLLTKIYFQKCSWKNFQKSIPHLPHIWPPKFFLIRTLWIQSWRVKGSHKKWMLPVKKSARYNLISQIKSRFSKVNLFILSTLGMFIFKSKVHALFNKEAIQKLRNANFGNLWTPPPM